MIDLIPKWTPVTVYNSDDWAELDNPTVRYEGFLLDSKADSPTVQILTDKGEIKKSVNSDRVQININNALAPKNGSELIPEGTNVVCSDYDDDDGEKTGERSGRFVRFGLDYNDDSGEIGNYTSAIVLLSDGEVEAFPVENIRVLPVENKEKERNPIIKRLKSIL